MTKTDFPYSSMISGGSRVRGLDPFGHEVSASAETQTQNGLKVLKVVDYK